MSKIEGQRYCLAGYELDTDDQGEMSRVYAVFAKRGANVVQLRSQSSKYITDVLTGRPSERPETDVYAMKGYDMIVAASDPDAFSKGTQSYLKEVVTDLGSDNLSKAFRKMAQLSLPKLDRQSRYFVPANGDIPKKING